MARTFDKNKPFEVVYSDTRFSDLMYRELKAVQPELRQAWLDEYTPELVELARAGIESATDKADLSRYIVTSELSFGLTKCRAVIQFSLARRLLRKGGQKVKVHLRIMGEQEYLDNIASTLHEVGVVNG